MYQTILFDLDGTLLDTLEDLTDAVNVVLKNFGYPEQNKSEIRAFLGNGLHRLIELAIPQNQLEPTKLEAAFLQLKSYYTEHCRIKTKPYPGVMELLQELRRRGCQTAIISNKNDQAAKSLGQYYFGDLVATTVGERAGVRRKPAPDGVMEVLRALKGEKKTTLYVGDSEVDWETAENAGLDCVLVDWGFRSREQLEICSAQRIISHPEELLDLCGDPR
jgi:phosphoglycolate phosphatase